MRAEDLARKIRLMVLDVDGVLTDGGLYYDAEGRIMKRFDVQDGLGIKLAQGAGMTFAVITGLNSSAVEKRVRELGVEEYHPGHHRKVPVLEAILERRGLTWDQVAYVGDDWVDAAPMKRVGLPMAVANAQPEILGLAAWISRAGGGRGAVREAVMFVLRARGEIEPLWEDWTS